MLLMSYIMILQAVTLHLIILNVMMLRSKGILTSMISNCSALRAPTILKTFVIRTFFFAKWLLTHILTGHNVKNPHASKLASDF